MHGGSKSPDLMAVFGPVSRLAKHFTHTVSGKEADPADVRFMRNSPLCCALDGERRFRLSRRGLMFKPQSKTYTLVNTKKRPARDALYSIISRGLKL